MMILVVSESEIHTIKAKCMTMRIQLKNEITLVGDALSCLTSSYHRLLEGDVAAKLGHVVKQHSRRNHGVVYKNLLPIG